MALLNSTVSYRHFKMRRTVFCTAFLLFFAVISLFSGSIRAQEVVPLMPVESEPVEVIGGEVTEVNIGVPYTDPYTVEMIEVDVTADNAVEARGSAFEAAQIKGYEMLASRFMSAQEMANFSTLDINAISALVKDYEVTNEQLSSVRYKGTYMIRFSPRAFQGRSHHAGAVPANAQGGEGGDVLILPFYERSGRTVLWEGNPFLEAWGRREGTVLPGSSEGQPVIPTGDIEDISQIQDEMALSYDPSRLNAMRLRYQAKEAVVLVAAEQSMPDGTSNMLVDIYKAAAYGPERYQQVNMQSFQGEAPGQFYNRVVMEVTQKIGPLMNKAPSVQYAGPNAVKPYQNPIPRTNTPPAAYNRQPTTGKIMAQLGYSSMKQWIEAKRSIERARGVNRLEVKALSPRQATVEIQHSGTITELRTALQQVGLGLNIPVTQSNAPMGNNVVYQLTTSPGRY